MDPSELIAVDFLAGCAVLSAVGLVFAALRGRRAADRMALAAYGWLAACCMLGLLVSCVAVSLSLAERAGTSRLALLGVVLANVSAQPFLLLFMWVGARKLCLGLTGRVARAWREVTDAELQGCGEQDRRLLARYGIVQGLIALPIAGGLSVACLWPLL